MSVKDEDLTQTKRRTVRGLARDGHLGVIFESGPNNSRPQHSPAGYRCSAHSACPVSATNVADSEYEIFRCRDCWRKTLVGRFTKAEAQPRYLQFSRDTRKGWLLRVGLTKNIGPE